MSVGNNPLYQQVSQILTNIQTMYQSKDGTEDAVAKAAQKALKNLKSSNASNNPIIASKDLNDALEKIAEKFTLLAPKIQHEKDLIKQKETEKEAYVAIKTQLQNNPNAIETIEKDPNFEKLSKQDRLDFLKLQSLQQNIQTIEGHLNSGKGTPKSRLANAVKSLQAIERAWERWPNVGDKQILDNDLPTVFERLYAQTDKILGPLPELKGKDDKDALDIISKKLQQKFDPARKPIKPSLLDGKQKEKSTKKVQFADPKASKSINYETAFLEEIKQTKDSPQLTYTEWLKAPHSSNKETNDKTFRNIDYLCCTYTPTIRQEAFQGVTTEQKFDLMQLRDNKNRTPLIRLVTTLANSRASSLSQIENAHAFFQDLFKDMNAEKRKTLLTQALREGVNNNIQKLNERFERIKLKSSIIRNPSYVNSFQQLVEYLKKTLEDAIAQS